MFCPNCGKSLIAGGRFCMACGARLPETHVLQDSAPVPEPSAVEDTRAIEHTQTPFEPSATSRVPPPTVDSVKPRNLGLNPFLSIWTQPRQTICKIVELDPDRYVFPLVYISAFFGILNQASTSGLGDELPILSIVVISVLAPIIAVALLNPGARFGRWVGSLLGGTASRQEVRAVIAWSTVPMTMWSCLLWPLQLLLFGSEVFSKSSPRIEAVSPGVALLFLVPGIVVTGWSTIVGLTCFAEVHRFSAWRALGAGLLGTAILFLPVALILAVVVLAAR